MKEEYTFTVTDRCEMDVSPVLNYLFQLLTTASYPFCSLVGLLSFWSDLGCMSLQKAAYIHLSAHKAENVNMILFWYDTFYLTLVIFYFI